VPVEIGTSRYILVSVSVVVAPTPQRIGKPGRHVQIAVVRVVGLPTGISTGCRQDWSRHNRRDARPLYFRRLGWLSWSAWNQTAGRDAAVH